MSPLEGHPVCHQGCCCLCQSGEHGAPLWSPLKEELVLRLQGANSPQTFLQQGLLLFSRGPAITEYWQRIGPGYFCPMQSVSKGSLCSGVPARRETLSDVQLGWRCPLLNPPSPNLRPPTYSFPVPGVSLALLH